MCGVFFCDIVEKVEEFLTCPLGYEWNASADETRSNLFKLSESLGTMIAWQGVLQCEAGDLRVVEVRPYERVDEVDVFWKKVNYS